MLNFRSCWHAAELWGSRWKDTPKDLDAGSIRIDWFIHLSIHSSILPWVHVFFLPSCGHLLMHFICPSALSLFTVPPLLTPVFQSIYPSIPWTCLGNVKERWRKRPWFMLVEVWGQGQGPPKANRLRGGAEAEGGSSEGGEISIKPTAKTFWSCSLLKAWRGLCLHPTLLMRRLRPSEMKWFSRDAHLAGFMPGKMMRHFEIGRKDYQMSFSLTVGC